MDFSYFFSKFIAIGVRVYKINIQAAFTKRDCSVVTTCKGKKRDAMNSAAIG